MDETVFLKIPLFKDLPYAELSKLVQELPVQDYRAGEYLFREGDPGEHLYVVITGQLEVLLAADTPEEMLLRVCGPGEYVGEMSLIMPAGQRTASVRARGDTRVWSMSRAKFNESIRRWPVLAYSMVGVLSQRLDDTNEPSFHDLQEKN